MESGVTARDVDFERRRLAMVVACAGEQLVEEAPTDVRLVPLISH